MKFAESILTLGLIWQVYLDMASNVKKEFELYEPMRNWLQRYLEEKYKGATVITIDSHARTLDLFLEENGVLDRYPQTVGLDIQIDVLGIVIKGENVKIAFDEAQKTQLNLHDLGQLWAYCRLCDPVEAFLLSSVGLGSLSKILNNLHRLDLLNFGDGKKIKLMKVCGRGIRAEHDLCVNDPLLFGIRFTFLVMLGIKRRAALISSGRHS